MQLCWFIAQVNLHIEYKYVYEVYISYVLFE